VHPTVRFATGVAIAALAVGPLTGCSGDPRTSSVDAVGSTVLEPAPSSTVAVDSTAPQVAASPLPTANAAATRDELLLLAASTGFGDAFPDSAMVGHWLETYPGLQRTLLDDQPADPTTVSVSPAFLTTPLSSDADQAWGFALVDSNGTCAGGVAVILGGGDPTLPPATVPTQFATVEGFTPCTARAAVDALVTGQ
jgi:hypothetical protein